MRLELASLRCALVCSRVPTYDRLFLLNANTSEYVIERELLPLVIRDDAVRFV